MCVEAHLHPHALRPHGGRRFFAFFLQARDATLQRSQLVAGLPLQLRQRLRPLSSLLQLGRRRVGQASLRGRGWDGGGGA